MANRKRSREQEVDPMYDMLFNMLIAFVFCFIIAFLSINPKAQKSGDIPAKAEVVFYGQATLDTRGKEATLVRFTIDPSGAVTNINTIPKSLAKSLT